MSKDRITVTVNGCDDEWTFDEVQLVYWTKNYEYGVVFKGQEIQDDLEGTISKDNYERLVAARPELQIYTMDEFVALIDEVPEEQPKKKFNMKEFCKKL